MNARNNKRLRLNVIDIIGVIVFSAVLIVSAYFFSLSAETKQYFNLEKTNIDYIVSLPSEDQITEIKNIKGVDKVIPFMYKSIDYEQNNKNIETDMYIINNESDIKYTDFSDELIIDKSSQNINEPLFISNDFAKKARLKVNDKVKINVNGADIDFTIKSIYQNDKRNLYGTIMCINNGKIKKALNNNFIISGAYVCAKDLSSADEYFSDFKPMGDLRTRDEFDTDEQYDIYLDDKKNSSDTNSVIYAKKIITEQRNRYNSKIKEENLMAYGCIAISLIVLILFTIIKSIIYIKNDVVKDLRNNFSVRQEKRMINTYSITVLILYLLGATVSSIVNIVIFKVKIVSIINIIFIIVAFTGSIISFIVSHNKFKRDFAEFTKGD